MAADATTMQGQSFPSSGTRSSKRIVGRHSGPAQIKIGENGEIKMTTETVAKVDVTEMVRARLTISWRPRARS